MQKDLQEKILAKDKWVRGVLMVVFAAIKYLVSGLINLVALFQFGVVLFTDHPNAKLIEFSKKLNLYLLQIINFLTFNSENKPFPFNNFPEN